MILIWLKILKWQIFYYHKYGSELCSKRSQLTTCVGSRAMMARSSSLAVSSSGRSVSYMPPGDLKSGMPQATETPAPVKNATRQPGFARMVCAMASSAAEDEAVNRYAEDLYNRHNICLYST